MGAFGMHPAFRYFKNYSPPNIYQAHLLSLLR